jgi:anti-sigma B factor antagonist
MPNFSIGRKTCDGVAILTINGHLDAHTFELLESEIRAVFNEGVFTILFDFSGVDYISSAGAGALIGAMEVSSENKGELVVANPSADVQEVVDLLGLSEQLVIAPSLEDAKRHVGLSWQGPWIPPEYYYCAEKQVAVLRCGPVTALNTRLATYDVCSYLARVFGSTGKVVLENATGKAMSPGMLSDLANFSESRGKALVFVGETKHPIGATWPATSRTVAEALDVLEGIGRGEISVQEVDGRIARIEVLGSILCDSERTDRTEVGFGDAVAAAVIFLGHMTFFRPENLRKLVDRMEARLPGRVRIELGVTGRRIDFVPESFVSSGDLFFDFKDLFPCRVNVEAGNAACLHVEGMLNAVDLAVALEGLGQQDLVIDMKAMSACSTQARES